jgi:RNA polymerase sigma-70 factor (ECF subfamily)
VRGLSLDMENQDAFPPWEEKALAALDTGKIDKALNALVEGCGRDILAYCIVRLGDNEIANDVAQEVFVAIWEALPSFRRESSLRTWIFVIAHHRCANRRRTIRRFGRIFSYGIDKTEQGDQPDPVDPPEAAVIKRQQAERLRHALEKLRRKERDLLIMYLSLSRFMV